jgi:hypothetical protein
MTSGAGDAPVVPWALAHLLKRLHINTNANKVEMKLETRKDFEELVKSCRKLGVTRIEVAGIKIELGDAPEPKSKKLNSAQSPDAPDEAQYTDEELLFWSSQTHELDKEASNG